jgi:hypothetical protein
MQALVHYSLLKTIFARVSSGCCSICRNSFTQAIGRSSQPIHRCPPSSLGVSPSSLNALRESRIFSITCSLEGKHRSMYTCITPGLGGTFPVQGSCLEMRRCGDIGQRGMAAGGGSIRRGCCFNRQAQTHRRGGDSLPARYGRRERARDGRISGCREGREGGFEMASITSSEASKDTNRKSS